jgi:hypothetical protein
MSNTFGAPVEELKQHSNLTTSMTSTPLKRIQQLCNDRAYEYRKSKEDYAIAMAMVFEHISVFCDAEMANEKQMLIDICNECASEISRGSIGLGKSVGEQLYKKKYS